MSKSTFKKYILIVITSFLTSGPELLAQGKSSEATGAKTEAKPKETLTVYDNFEGSKKVWYYQKSGVLDTLAKNPAPGEANKSTTCALYVRNASKKFDNIKMCATAKLETAAPFATYEGVPPKLKMKLYTTAPPGTLVEILLGSKGRNSEYPAGTHSQYQAYTKKSGEWEELEFLFSQVPQGSETAATDIDQITLLFNPNSTNSDTYYFDEISGPGLTVVPAAPDKKETTNKKK
jgi:hypothetical protein